MKVVAIFGERKAGLVDKPDPKAKGDFVVVKVHCAPMCTEYKAFLAGHETDGLGHEAAGEVVEVAQPGRVKVGDRVVVMPQLACGGCPLCLAGDYIHCEHPLDLTAQTGNTCGTATYAQYVVQQDWLLVPIPPQVSYEHAAMACCGLGPTFGAMQRMRVDAFDTVLITGLGPVGLGGVINARFRGARVIGVDSNEFRARLARKLGAEALLDPRDEDVSSKIRDLTAGVGTDKAVDCSGAAQAQRLCIQAARCKGHVAFVGEGGPVEVHVSSDMIRKGLTLHGAWHYNLADTPRVMQVIVQSGAALDTLITHTFALSQVQQAFELQATGNSAKVVLEPWA